MKKLILFLCYFLTCASALAYVPITTDARIKTLIYSPTEVFNLKFHHNYQSYIEFPETEELKVITLGDSYGWDMTQVDNRLFIRPKQKSVQTNLTVITEQRPYHFEIISSDLPLDQIDAELVLVAKFFYPETTYDFMQTVKIKKPLEQYNLLPVEQNNLQSIPQTLPVAPVQNPVPPIPPAPQVPAEEEVSLQENDAFLGNIANQAENKINPELSYNYNYSVVGTNTEISPVKIYDDGINTYFEFADNLLPDIFYVNRDGSETAATYSVENGLVKVRNTAWQFSLRNNRDVVCVFNEKKLNFTNNPNG